MASFAQIDENNVVINVVTIPDDQEHRGEEFLAKDLNLGGRWIQTSVNTHNFQHPENRQLRGNFACIGGTYDEARGVFIPPKPYPSFVLNGVFEWVPPFEKPKNNKEYIWSEERRNWIEIPQEITEEGEPA